MNKLKLILVSLLAGCASMNLLQGSEDQPLVTVADKEVFTDEFIYAFNKNRPLDSAVSQVEVDEYLDLYVNFKLKVAEANSRGMDTTAEFLKEYKSYIDQLDNSYLQSGNDTEELVAEAYQRLQSEVRASHILFTVDESAVPFDTLIAYNKALSLRDSLVNGGDFDNLAIQYSNDPSAKKNKGDLGYFTVFQMVYPFETAAYTTKVGETSLPVRTKFGYHLIKVIDKRPNEGKVKVAHIMIRKQAGDQAKAFELYDQLKSGANWEDLCKQNSDDTQSASQGGVLASFSRSQIVPEFAEAAFNLTTPGELSDPIQTAYGWHIIKLIERIPVSDYESNRRQLSSQVRRDARSQISRKRMLERLASENNLKENSENVQFIVQPESHKFLKNKWLFDRDTLGTLELFSLNQETFLASGYYEFLERTTTHQETKSFLFDQYKKFKEQSLIEYEKAHLSEKHSEYKFLKQEYHDGILLFSIMEEEVWAKAGRDSVGLAAYYEENKLSFIDTTKLSAVIFSSANKIIIDSISQALSDKTAYNRMSKAEKETLLARNNKDTQLSLQLDRDNFIISEHPILSNLTLPYVAEIIEVGNKWYYVIPLRDPSIPLPLDEVKGNLIADYQEVLEDDWLKSLTTTYSVNVNKATLKKVYKELGAE